MKSTFGLLRQAELGLISLFPMVVACIRSAPRDEPAPLVGQISSQKDSISAIITPTEERGNKIPKDSTPYASILDQLLKKYSNVKDINTFFKEIGWSQDLTIRDLQDPANRLMPNTPFNRLFIFFEKNAKNGGWCEPRSIEPISITIRSNSLLPNSEKDTYALVGFLVDTTEKLDISEKNDSKDSLILIACVKNNEQWCYYNNDYTHKTDFLTTEAMQLASERGIIFFYRKKEKVA